MALLPLAVTDETLPDLLDLPDTSMRTIACGGALTCLVMTGDDEPMRSEAHLLAVHRTLCAMARRVTLVPMRLGAAAGDERGVVRLMETRASHLRRALDRVRGCVEYTLTLHAWPEQAGDRLLSTASASPGVVFLAERKRAIARAEGVDEALLAQEPALKRALGGLVREARLEGPTRVRTSPALCCLVPWDRQEAFERDACERAGVEGFEASLAGPLACHSFV